MKFRHFIRHAYGFQLEWSVMEDLVNKIENVWNYAKDGINKFIEVEIHL